MARVKGLDRRRYERRAGALEGRKSQAPRTGLEVRREVALGVGDPSQDRVGVPEQDLARLCQARPLAVAFDQQRTRLALQSRDLLADRRLRVGQRISCGGERAALRELP